jgi:hypothetical protein
MPNSPRTAARRRANAIYAEHMRRNALARRNRAARTIQARVRGMLTREHLTNPSWGRTYANVVAGRKGLGYRAVMAMLTRSPNRAATGSRIRAGIRYGPEHYVSNRATRHWRQHYISMGPAAWKGHVKGINSPRGSITRRTPSPKRRNNNLW